MSARKTKHDDLTQAFRKATTGASDTLAEKPEEAPDTDLDDPVTQQDILHPEGTLVELSYGSIRLYPPTAMAHRLAYGFCSKIWADASEKAPSSPNILAMRIMEALMSAAAPQMQLFRLASSMCGKPGSIDEAQALELSVELAEKCDQNDVAMLFTKLCTAVGMNQTAKK